MIEFAPTVRRGLPGFDRRLSKEVRAISEITELLDRCRDGDSASLDAVFTRLYAELRRIAAGKLAKSRHGETVTPTMLVHEAYLKLTAGAPLVVESQRHFYTCAAKAMRHILVDRARRAVAEKRGGERRRITWTERLAEAVSHDVEVLELEQALSELAAINDRGREVVELRFFAGLTAEDTAELLGVSLRTVHREWQRSRAFLHARLDAAQPDAAPESEEARS